MSALEIVLRLALTGGSAGVNLVGSLNVWISGILGLASMVATAELAVRPYGSSVFDRLLLMAGGLVAAFILLGIALNFTPWGLTRETWNASWAVVSILVLIARRGTRARFTAPRRSAITLTLSIAAAAAIILGAGWLALAGVAKSDSEPVLSLSLVSENSTNMIVEVDARSVKGSYRIVAFPEEQKSAVYVSAPLSLSAGPDGESVRRQVPARDKGTWVVYLRAAAGGKALRELIANIS